jgi:prefoldin subunit 5
MDLDRLNRDFSALAEHAAVLNKASDELRIAIDTLDSALQKLNIGLPIWVSFDEELNLTRDYGSIYEVGYDKVNGRWCLAIRREDRLLQGTKLDGPWPYNDAARDLRLLAVQKLPDVIQELTKQAAALRTKVSEAAQSVRALADAIGGKSPKPNSGVNRRILVTNFSSNDLEAIRALVRNVAPAVDNLLDGSIRWSLNKGKLKILFAAKYANDYQHFMIHGLTFVSVAARQVLNIPIVVEAELQDSEESTVGGTK